MTTLPPGRVIGSAPTVWLHEGWRLARTAPGALKEPGELAGSGLQWHEAVVPGTVAAAIHSDLSLPGDYDADDWWYRVTFEMQNCARHERFVRNREDDQFVSANEKAVPGTILRLEGLATLAEVWLNGTKILSSRNMFVTHRVDVTALLRDRNELAICFRSLGEALKQKRPRAKWKTQLVEQQNLRWFRTTLLGRIPGWSPAITPVGPWGPIGIESAGVVEVDSLRVHATRGALSVEARVSRPVDEARVRIGEATHALRVDGDRVDATVEVAAPSWWPHTHGTPHLEPCLLELRRGDEWITVDCGRVGFRDIRLDTGDGAVRFIVNGVPIFCRGACWTTMDILKLRGDPTALRHALETLRDAGANMLRIGGTMMYESDDFYRLCDELGILVWQDFMFANMDYPVGDAGFRREIEDEARQQLARLHRHPCIAAYCGGSEVAQQAAMMGLGPERWSNDFFLETLPALCDEFQPGVAYFPSSPWGGALPFHVSAGIAHYYGVGAYRRPIADVKTASVKFATECLGLSNVPEGEHPPPHHPSWKARVPRDSGSGYDFEDVRDFYLEEFFGVDATKLRAQDVSRYYAVSRVVSGEVMARAYAQWRSPASGCAGALVWFARDLWPGAGWGLTDSSGEPKAALWYLKRAWSPQSIHLTDEGLDGHAIHAVNETAEPLEAIIEFDTCLHGRPGAAAGRTAVTIPPRGTVSLQADALLGYFTDSTNAYRFGPAKYDVAIARLLRADSGELVSEDFHFPTGMNLPAQHHAKVEARATRLADGRIEVALSSDVFLQAVRVSCKGALPDANYFHVAPGRERRIVFPGQARLDATFEALNWPGALRISA